MPFVKVRRGRRRSGIRLFFPVQSYANHAGRAIAKKSVFSACAGRGADGNGGVVALRERGRKTRCRIFPTGRRGKPKRSDLVFPRCRPRPAGTDKKRATAIPTAMGRMAVARFLVFSDVA